MLRRFSTVEVAQYIGGYSVHRGHNISTVGIASVQLWGDIASVLWRLIASVLWRLFSTVADNISRCGGITSVLWRDNSSTCEG